MFFALALTYQSILAVLMSVTVLFHKAYLKCIEVVVIESKNNASVCLLTYVSYEQLSVSRGLLPVLPCTQHTQRRTVPQYWVGR